MATRAAATAGRREEVAGERAARSSAGDVTTNAMVLVGRGGEWKGDARTAVMGVDGWVWMSGWIAEVVRTAKGDASLWDGRGA